MRLFLVRHGQTDANLKNLALGRADVPLNDTGRRQAALIAKALAGEGLAAVYSSPLQRAHETARAIAAACGLEVRTNPGLIEMDIGEMDGLDFKEVRERWPDVIEAWLGAGGPEERMPGGERLVDVQRRAWKTVERLAERHRDDEAVCAVTHNFVILSVLTNVLGVELSQFRRLRHEVAAITVLERRDRRFRVVRLNDTCHLEAGG
jgi:broad specificity phosphatase PhoE